jgi:hypothetical protein
MRTRGTVVAFALGLGLSLAATSARAVISVGETAPDFTKLRLVGTAEGPPVSLSDYGHEVKILFILGFD